MKLRHLLPLVIVLSAACSARQRDVAPPSSPAALAAGDSTIVMLDGERILPSDVKLISQSAIHSISTLKGEAARARYGRDAREVIEIVSKDGRRSATSNAAPLVMVDGRTISTTLLNVLDPSVITKIDVVKGEEAAERYGERARSGVILITTKLGG